MNDPIGTPCRESSPAENKADGFPSEPRTISVGNAVGKTTTKVDDFYRGQLLMLMQLRVGLRVSLAARLWRFDADEWIALSDDEEVPDVG